MGYSGWGIVVGVGVGVRVRVRVAIEVRVGVGIEVEVEVGVVVGANRWVRANRYWVRGCIGGNVLGLGLGKSYVNNVLIQSTRGGGHPN